MTADAEPLEPKVEQLRALIGVARIELELVLQSGVVQPTTADVVELLRCYETAGGGDERGAE